MKNKMGYLSSLFFVMGLCLPHSLLASEMLALLDLKPEHRVDKRLAEAFSGKIREEMGRLGLYEVLSKGDLAKIAKKTEPDCEDMPCLINFARAAGAKYLVVGSLSKLGSTYYVELRVINTQAEEPIIAHTVSEKYRCTEDELLGKAKILASLIPVKEGGQEKMVETRPPAPKQKTGPERMTNSIGMEFVLIRTGTFMMGSPADEVERSHDEVQHGVTISLPFYMQITEVTQEQWKRVMGNNPSHFQECGGDCPVETVSWKDAQRFVKRLNELEGTDKYRLPTEAEWEYAGRAETTTPFHTGNCISTDQANYNGIKPLPGCPEGEHRKHPVRVKSFKPNAWGLYDMHGNVWEWCKDWKEPYPGDLETPPLREGRVLRGGSWLDGARNLRSARRFMYAPDYGDYDIGFRVVKDF